MWNHFPIVYPHLCLRFTLLYLLLFIQSYHYTSHLYIIIIHSNMSARVSALIIPERGEDAEEGQANLNREDHAVELQEEEVVDLQNLVVQATRRRKRVS